MKNNSIQKICYGLFLLFISISVSCDSDDDLLLGPVVNVNSFCYGPDASGLFISTDAYNREVIETTTGVFSTVIFITDEGLALDTNNDLNGNGFLLTVNLYGDRTQGFQSGTYIIGNTTDVGDVLVSYSESYDSSLVRNPSVQLVNGIVAVSPYRNGYAIEFNAEDENGDRFHGIYLGIVEPIN